MANIKEYTDHRGRIFRPVLHTESFAYYRCDHFGHIETRMHRVDPDTCEVNINRLAKSFRAGVDDPRLWMAQNSESMPQQYVPEESRSRITGIPKTAEEKEIIKAENVQRLRKSREKLDEAKKAKQ